MAISTFRRYERKFLLPEAKLDGVLSRIGEYMIPDKYCLDGKYYTICNIYFDNDGDDVIRHSISSPYFKEKLRLRSYGTPSDGSSTVYFELKKKTAKLVTKRRCSMTLAQAEDYIYKGISPSFDKYLDAQVMTEIDYFVRTNEVRPKLYLSYDRRAFFCRDDSDIRLTIDFNVTTRRDDLFLEHGIYGTSLLPSGMLLMEIKVPDALPMFLTSMLSEYEIYPTSYSKYGKEFAEYTKNKLPDKELNNARPSSFDLNK